MARDFARSFYRSKQWLRNRKLYMDAYVDMDGHIVRLSDEGCFYWVDEYGDEVVVSEKQVVPPRMCERCFALGRLVPAKVVHHIEWLDPTNIEDPHITLSFSNFMRLCQDCHAAVHAEEEEGRVFFDENGNVIWKDEA